MTRVARRALLAAIIPLVLLLSLFEALLFDLPKRYRELVREDLIWFREMWKEAAL